MRGPTAFRRPRWQSHSDTAIGLRGPARRSGRHDTHPMQRRGAKSFVDDLVLSRGVVLSRAAASLRSIETKPFRLADLSAIDGHICRQMSKRAGAANEKRSSLSGMAVFFL